MAAEAGGDVRAGIGSRLRAAREKKGLTVLQAAERMHVDARTLESLEAEDFAALGAPVYARGHLRHYAELVDESAPELQQLYADATRATPAQPDLTRIARRLDPGNDSGKLVGRPSSGWSRSRSWVRSGGCSPCRSTRCSRRRFTTRSKATRRSPTAERTPARARPGPRPRLTPALRVILRCRCRRRHPSRPRREARRVAPVRRAGRPEPSLPSEKFRACGSRDRPHRPRLKPPRRSPQTQHRRRPARPPSPPSRTPPPPRRAAGKRRRAHPEILIRQLGRSLRRLGPAIVLRRGCGILGAHGAGSCPAARDPRQRLRSCCRVQRSSGPDPGRRTTRRKRAVCHQRARTDRAREPRIRRRLSW